MYKIAYIEPVHNLLSDVYKDPNLQLNDFLFDRLAGIRKAVQDNFDIDFTWLNNSLDTKHFISSGQYKDYDGVLLTAPDEATCKLIAEHQEDKTVFVVSADADPHPDLNYVGPDHDADLNNILDAVGGEGVSRIAFVACWKFNRTLEILDAAERVFKKRELAFNRKEIIGWGITDHLPKGQPPRDAKLDWAGILTDEIVKHLDKQLFIFVDAIPWVGIYRELISNRGIKVPEQVKLLSLRGNAIFPQHNREIYRIFSYINQDFNTIGQVSVSCLYDILQRKRERTGNKLLIPGAFIKGTTTAPARIMDTQSREYFVNSVENYIKKHYKEPITAQSIAAALEISYNYFLSKFIECFNCNMKDYLNRIRLDMAARLLLTTTYDNTRIFTEAGFSSRATFNRLFLKRFGISPLQYRKKLQK